MRSNSLALVLCGLSLPLFSQSFNPSFYQAMRWRQIGPFRAGRVTAVAGIPGNAAVYYMGTPGGGLWKTVDGGMVWTPIFDQVRVDSIGAVSVAPSNPDIVYVGTGDVSMVGGSVNFGKGVYKSTDAGKTWRHIGLEETEHIGNLWIDPRNPDVVLVAALGRTYSKNEQRGIFKTTDGGKSWKKVLYKDDITGAVDLAFAASNPNVGFAALMEHYTRPGAGRGGIETSGFAGVYKTTDGGDTWTQVTEGLPGGRFGRIGVAVSADGRKAFAIVAGGGFGGGGGGGAGAAGGLYRSDDSGAHWTKSTQDSRIQGSGYFSRVFLDPKNPDIVYVAQTSLYRSEDGGHSFSSYKGAPGGDDNHALWIDPTDSNRMMMASDQGGTISMDGGKSWSSWYNQPTGQIYHLSTDNRYPYWVYGTQQDSGSIGTLSRGDYGEITFMDWDPVGGYEFGYIVPDPLNPNLVYAGGPSRGVVRIDRSNRQVATVSPNVTRNNDYRMATNPPLAFAPQDPHAFYMAAQYLLETRDGGVHWKTISPDLTTRANAAPEPSAEAAIPGAPAPARPRAQEQQETMAPMNRAAINTFSLSPVAAGEIWAGTNNGLIHITKDAGTHWQDVTPPGLGAYTQISILEASHFDAAAAYAAVDRHEENDFKPHILRTRDSGKTWQETVAGIPDGSFVRVVREDPARKGLLYAGTESAVYVSFDDGDHWGPLQLNMPTCSVRDLVIHGDDLVAATYGRAFWILDDLTPLRQIDRVSSSWNMFLFRPEKALRVRLDLNQDTPLPPEMPAGQNPPNGAILDYYLAAAPSNDITLEIVDGAGKLVRKYSTAAEPASTEPPPNVPDYWIGHPEPLTKQAGMNRFVWDLRYAAPPVLRHEYPISALYGNTPGLPLGAMVTPGNYRVRLTVNGRTLEQPLTVAMDQRVDVTSDALGQQLSLESKVIDLVAASFENHRKAGELRRSIAASGLKDLDQKLARLEGTDGGFGGGGGGLGGRQAPTFAALNRNLGSLASVVDGQDAAPTPAMQTAYEGYCKEFASVVQSWNDLLKTDLAATNADLAKRGVLEAPSCK